ncbi:MAG: hypothetical protein EXS08_01050 [Planctomycetes bacterium]|nr:hypothetical protein [Planctomycetota bacterium]
MSAASFLRALLEARLAPTGRAWLDAAVGELAAGVAPVRGSALFSQASRHARRVPLAPTAQQCAEAGRILEGWNPERWNVLEAMRVTLLLARRDLAADSGVQALTELFRYADEGELCALLRSLALLPAPERFVWRAGEGCRSNMRSVFEAAALDTPYPARHFDDLAWRQCAIKCLFVGAPLWRLWALDTRLSDELARMALDLAEERRSAGRPVPPELWLCLGTYGGARGLAALERELASANPNALGRRAAVLALARAAQRERFAALECANEPALRDVLSRVRAGETSAPTFRHLEPA